jgi:hypothetical protein
MRLPLNNNHSESIFHHSEGQMPDWERLFAFLHSGAYFYSVAQGISASALYEDGIQCPKNGIGLKHV